jgi:hypothetical protein
MLQALVAQQITIEPTFVSTVLQASSSQVHFLLGDTWPNDISTFTRADYLKNRLSILKGERFCLSIEDRSDTGDAPADFPPVYPVIFKNAGKALQSGSAVAGSSKPFVYRCINHVLAAMQQNYSVSNIRSGKTSIIARLNSRNLSLSTCAREC